MKERVIITLCLALVAFAASAQTITDDLRRDKQGQGKVVINQSADIERLVNNLQVTTTKVTTPQQTPSTPPRVTTPSTTPQRTAPQGATTPQRPAAPATAPQHSQDDSEASSVSTTKKVMRRSYKTSGYRIQVYSGNNREGKQKCESIASRLKGSFPSYPIYVHFYSPNWKCRMGNFTDYGEAQEVLKQVKAMGYTQACLVKGTISVQY